MYRQNQDASAGAEQQYQLSGVPTSFSYPGFHGPFGGIVENTYRGGQHLSPQPVMRTPIEPQGAMRPPSRSLSPRFGTPSRNVAVPYTPTDRALPSRAVTADTITVAYVAFILYCNPKFPLDVETSTLRTTFQTPPKSDNKDFEIFRLYELIQKFDSKEIKTWGQLALDLGVEAPDTSKGQSVQKVQQYSVRLKRWMRAMHVDAFFEYLLGKQHSYFTDIPHPSDPHPVGGRDGVIAEEDLAIRALDPSFRPKRGRRRNSEVEQDDENETGSASKQPRLSEEPSQIMPGSAHPMSAMQLNQSAIDDPWAVASAVTPATFAPWANKQNVPQSAVSATAPSHIRWQLHGSNQHVSTPHPMTAQPTSMVSHIEAAFANEPKSAITPSRKRRKHGPAVSSAWPSANPPGAKPRGRPPVSRNVQDGPFSTFPADPANDKSQDSQAFIAPTAQMEMKADDEDESMSAMPPPAMRQSDGLVRPGRLSLQVPPHTGAPVRLATPPRVLVNGESNEIDPRDSSTPDIEPTSRPQAATSARQKMMLPSTRDIPGFAFEALKRVLASDLLRAELIGRRQRLTGDEAKRLADAMLQRFGIPREDTEKPRDDIARITAASWLGIGEQLSVPFGPAAGQNKRITVTRFRIDRDGYEEIVSAYDDSPSGNIREVFDLSWTIAMGGCNGILELKGIELADPGPKEPDFHDLLLETWTETAAKAGVGQDSQDRFRTLYNNRKSRADVNFGSGTGGLGGPDGRFPAVIAAGGGGGDEAAEWKSRYRALEFGTKIAKGEFERFKHRVLETVLDALE